MIVRVSVVLKRTVVGDYTHPDDHTIRTTDTPGFKPFTSRILLIVVIACATLFSEGVKGVFA